MYMYTLTNIDWPTNYKLKITYAKKDYANKLKYIHGNVTFI